jgi:hypothetical protein
MPTTTNTLGQRVLARVAMQLGGAEIAAQRLGIAPSLLRRFIDGSMPVPDVILLRAVDYILEDISEPNPPASQSLPDSKRDR